MTFKLLPTFAMPGTVEAEDFVTNKGGSIVSTADGFAWGNAANGDYAEYSVKVNQAGKYAYEATVASDIDNSKISMTLIDGNGNEMTLGTVTVPNTGSNNSYTLKTGNIRNKITEKGMQKLRFTIKSGNCNIDKVNFVCTEPVSGIDEIETVDVVNGPAYNLMGVPVNAGYRGIVIKNGKKVVIK